MDGNPQTTDMVIEVYHPITDALALSITLTPEQRETLLRTVPEADQLGGAAYMLDAFCVERTNAD